MEATGHADIVQLDDGSWWGVFLATRPFAGQSTLLGRETFLLPLEWQDGWPRFLDRGEAVPMQLARPNLPLGEPVDRSAWREDFNASLSDEWIGLRTPGTDQQLAVDTGEGVLRLIAGSAAAGSLGKPAFAGRRVRHHSADIVTRVDFDPSRPGEFAGLLAFMDENHFLAVGKEQGRLVVRLRTDAAQSETGEVVAVQALRTNGPVELRIALRAGSAQMSWRGANETRWQTLGGPINVEPLASIHAGLFTGLVVGPYAYAPE